MYSFLMIRKKLSYNIQSMLTMPAFRGLNPTGLYNSLCLLQASLIMGVTAASFSQQNMKIIAYMTAILTEVFIFDDKKKQINHYDLLLAFTVEPSTNHSRDSSLLSLLYRIETASFKNLSNRFRRDCHKKPVSTISMLSSSFSCRRFGSWKFEIHFWLRPSGCKKEKIIINYPTCNFLVVDGLQQYYTVMT